MKKMPDVLLGTLIIFLTPILYALSKQLREIDSIERALTLYEEYPEDSNFINNYLLFWKYKYTRLNIWWLINNLGDKTVTALFKIVGYFYLIALVLLWMLFALLIIQVITI
jgi:hypothetical protein